MPLLGYVNDHAQVLGRVCFITYFLRVDGRVRMYFTRVRAPEKGLVSARQWEFVAPSAVWCILTF